MLKIRISGTQEELEKIVELMDDAEIVKFKHKKGKTTYAIDTIMTVEEFLKQNESIRALNEQESEAEIEKQIQYEKNIKSINQELTDLLDVINDSDSSD